MCSGVLQSRAKNNSEPGAQTTTRQAATLKAIILSNWISQDMRGMRSYVTSYTLRSGNSELFTIHLNRQLGFYQISEFISTDAKRNFIIEQTNRVGTPKIAAFDKDSGNMLGVFKGNTLLDANEAPIFHIKPMISLSADSVCPAHTANPEDYAGLIHGQKNIAAIFSRMPHSYHREGMASRLRRWTNRFTHAPVDVLEALVVEEDICDLRMICAVAVVLHSRGGLHLR